MNPKIKSFFINPWTIGIGCAIIPLFPITFFWNGLENLLICKIEIPIWGLILLTITTNCLGILGFWLITQYKDKKSKSSNFKYLEYIEDTINGAYYRWQYKYYNNIYLPCDVKMYCLKDKCLVVDDFCPVCKFIYIRENEDSQDELIAIIRYRIESKYGIMQV